MPVSGKPLAVWSPPSHTPVFGRLKKSVNDPRQGITDRLSVMLVVLLSITVFGAPFTVTHAVVQVVTVFQRKTYPDAPLRYIPPGYVPALRLLNDRDRAEARERTWPEGVAAGIATAVELHRAVR